MPVAEGNRISEMISGLEWLAGMRGYKQIEVEFTGWVQTPRGSMDYYKVKADEMVFTGDCTGITIDMMNLPARDRS